MKNGDLNNNELPKEIKTDNDNINPLLDIISSIQEKLDSSNQTINANNNTYIPQTQNYSNQTINSNDSHNNNQSGSFNTAKLIEMLSGINSVPNYNSSNNKKNTESASNYFANLDMDTMIRMGKIFSSMNREDPRKNLLLSLKPFLRDNRQRNVDTYIFLLGILNVIDSFNNGDSDF